MHPTPVTRSRLPLVAIGVWALILAAIVVVGLAFGGRGASATTTSPAGAAGIPLVAPLAAASPSAGASAAPGASTAPEKGAGPGAWAGPKGDFRAGPGGPGHPGGPEGRGGITITAINGSQLSLKTDDGWTRTIDATGATVTESDGTAITVGDLKVGDQIGLRQTRNTDGTYTITAIVRIPPQASGTVKSVDAGSATLTQPDGTTKTIGLTASTTYTLNGQAATAADLKVGTRTHATGTVDTNGAFTATKVNIAPAEIHGTMTAKTADTITVKDAAGATVTVHVTASTTYRTRGNAAATLNDVAVNDVIEAEGTLNADGSLAATTVTFGQPGANGGPGFSGPGFGRGPGGHGRGGPGGPGTGNGGGTPGASPAPSANAG